MCMGFVGLQVANALVLSAAACLAPKRRTVLALGTGMGWTSGLLSVLWLLLSIELRCLGVSISKHSKQYCVNSCNNRR